MVASLPPLTSTKTRVFNVDYFLRRTPRIANGIAPPKTLSAQQQVLELPQQPSAIEVTDIHSYQVFYNVRGERIIRRPLATHKPKRVSLTFNISSFEVQYPKSPRPAQVNTHSNLSAKEVLAAFSALVQEMRAGINKYELVDLSRGVVYSDCELSDYAVMQSASNQRFGYTVTLSLIAFSQGVDVGTISQPIVPQITIPPSSAPSLSAFERYLAACAVAQQKLRGLAKTIRYAGYLVQDTIGDAVGAPLGIIDAAVATPLALASAVDSISQGINDTRNAIAVTSAGAATAVQALTRATHNMKTLIQSFNPSADNSIYSQYADAALGSWKTLDSAIPEMRQSAVTADQAGTQLAVAEASLIAADAELAAELAYGYLRIKAPEKAEIVQLGVFLADPRNTRLLASFSGNVISSATQNNVASVPYTLRLGESLVTIASSLTGDATRWVELAQLNNWTSPYTDQEDRVVPAGARINIPLTMLPDVNATTNYNLLFNAGDPLLADLRLKEDDITLKDDEMLLQGIGNLQQAIINRLRTPLSACLGLPSYGRVNVLGTTQESTVFLVNEVVTQLLADPRVYAVNNVQVLLNGDSLDVSLQLQTADQQSIDLLIPLN